MPYKQSHPLATFREVIFHLADSSGTAQTGKTFSTTDLQIRKPGASTYSNCDATQQSAVVEIGAGDYAYTFTTTELNTPGASFAFKTNKSGCVSQTLTDSIAQAFFATAISGTLTATTFTSDRGETVDGFWDDALVIALTGALIGQVKKIGNYTGSSKLFTLAAGLAFTAAPANTDVFEIINR